MGVISKKKIYPSSTNEDDLEQTQISDRRRSSGQQHRPLPNHHRILKQHSSTAAELDDDGAFGGAKRNRTFIIRKAFESGLNQLSSKIKKPVNHKRISKLDSNQDELLHTSGARKRGCSPFQLGGYLVILLMTGLLFVYFLPQLSFEDAKLIYVIYAICILITVVHSALLILATIINPADDNVIAKQREQPNRPVPTFDPTQQKHVIENSYCAICDVLVGKQSKHCSRCNVCIADFDHHCYWLNNCIGGKNYKLFISSVISALIGASVVLGLSILFLVCWADSNSSCVWLNNPYITGFDVAGELDDLAANEADFTSQPSTLLSSISDSSLDIFTTTINSTFDFNSSTENSTNLSANSTDPPEEEEAADESSVHHLTIINLFVIFMSLLLSSITVILLLHLLCFHLFLNCIGMSTYEFIVQRREQHASGSGAGQKETNRRPTTCTERILNCLSCQSDICANLSLSKAQDGELATSQSIIDKNQNYANLIKKRQLSQQMSNESRMSRNSRESGRFSSRTVSLYEDLGEDTPGHHRHNLATSAVNESESTQVYIGDSQKRVLEEHDLMKTLNNRSLASSVEQANEPASHESHRTQQPQLDQNHNRNHNRNQIHQNVNGYASPPTSLPPLAIESPRPKSMNQDKVDSLNRIAELNANELLINDRRLENLDKQRNQGQSVAHRAPTDFRLSENGLAVSRVIESRPSDTRATISEVSDTKTDDHRSDDDDLRSDSKLDNRTLNRYLDNLDEYMNRQLSSETLNAQSTDQHTREPHHHEDKNLDD